jgi:FAD/FMN-containing dehydrogenase
MSAGHRPEGAQVSEDISVPVSRIPDFLREAGEAAEKVLPGSRIVAFGHMGDGNIHYSVLAPIGMPPEAFPFPALNDAVNGTAVALGGSISAEHGIGVVRLADFARFKDPESLSLMRAVKRALDPNNVMNPRVLVA